MKGKELPHLLIVYPNQFGYHTDSYMYCKYLRNEYSITYFCFDQGLKKNDLDGIRIKYVPYKSGRIVRLLRFYQLVINFTRHTKVDIIFTIQFKLCFLLAIFSRAKVKILDYRTGNLSLNPLLRKIGNCFLKIDSLFFRHITVISEGLLKILHLNRSRTLILPLGGDSISTQLHSFEILNLLYVGTLTSRNIYQTIAGLAIFLSKYPDIADSVSYSIIGFGTPEDETKIKETIDLYLMNNNVHFLGHIKFEDLTSHFNSSNIGVSYVPKTPYYDHQPVTKTFEYANSGLFTIATSTFENRQVITDENGILCEDTPEDFAIAIEKVYLSRHEINDLKIRSSLTDYLWIEIIRNILKPYLAKLLTE
jgi:glycosyltransferase involved in cell wall biosynthesis